eukprot:scaffold22056_cov52-Phaeocystis_antarctica.AAC.5
MVAPRPSNRAPVRSGNALVWCVRVAVRFGNALVYRRASPVNTVVISRVESSPLVAFATSARTTNSVH